MILFIIICDSMFGRRISFFLILIGALLMFSGIYIEYDIYQQEEDYFITTKKSYYQLFNDNKDPIEELSLSQIEKVEAEVKKINRHDEEKGQLINEIGELKKYFILKEEINNSFPNKILNSTVDLNTISEIEENYSDLLPKYQKYFEADLVEIKNQKSTIDGVLLEIDELFVDLEKTNLKENVTKDQVESVRGKLSLLKQQDLVENKNNELNNAINILNIREEEARKSREEKIRNAWVILNVPYISQNNNNVLNGCEAASLLMGLQYKGYLQSMTLQQYALDMPKSKNNNAYEGFTHDIFGLDPMTITHWIAPNALAEFGRNSSSNQNVIDGTGYSLDDLDNEILNNNPVVIYATSYFKTPKEWIEGAPRNLHVLLLTGYNKITQEQIVTDPWTQVNGKNKWYLSKSQLETIYNAVGKKSVIIR